METSREHILDKLKKHQAPLPGEAYFASLKAGLIEKAAIAPVVPLYRRKWLIGCVAAAVMLCVLIGRFWKTEPQPTAVDWNSISREELLAYVDEHIDDFDASAIAEQLDNIPEWHSTMAPMDTISVVGQTVNQSDELFDELENEEILKYLQEEVIELDDELLIGS